jgi:hypothetical protein
MNKDRQLSKSWLKKNLNTWRNQAGVLDKIKSLVVPYYI